MNTHLLSWFEEVGITTDADLVSLQFSAGVCEVRSKSHVSEGAVLGTVPAAACLSVQTASIANIIEAERLGGGLGLVLAVMHEVQLGPQSRWYGAVLALSSAAS